MEFLNKMLLVAFIFFVKPSNQGWAMGRESHGICVPGHESRDLGPGLGLILLGRLGLGQISLGQSRDKNLWDSQIPSFGTSWDTSPMGFWSPMGPIRIFGTCVPWDFESQM